MSFLRFLQDKAVAIIIGLFAIVFITFMLIVLDLSRDAVILLDAIIIFTVYAVLLYEYAKKRQFYNTLASLIEGIDQPYLIFELLDRPDFHEGGMLYDALALSSKSMNDRIGEYRTSSEEYREYIETWIHEIKTPIAAAKLITENNRSAAMDTVASELDRIDTYVEQALFYSRSSNVEKDYIIRRIMLGDVVRTAVRRHAKALIGNDIALDLSALDFEVFADAKWVDFILGQIIVNAVKYRETDGSRTSTLRFSAYAEGERIVLDITDNGIGIPEKDLAKVFEKGFTGENGRRFAKSTGIGLFLCHRLCEKMGLSMRLTSKSAEGTCVSIIFPQNRMQVDAVL